MPSYKAPWDRALLGWSLSLIAVAVLAVVLFWPSLTHGPSSDLLFWKGVVLPAYTLGCALFTVRGYVIEEHRIKIRRLLWSTHLPLTGLQSVESHPGALRKAAYQFGNGGYFSYCGWYQSKELGPIRPFVTDRERTVVLRYPKRTIILSPDRPEEFVQSLRSKAGLA